MLELALLLPFLSILAMSSFEVYKAFQSHQYLSLVSREVGNEAIRSCSALAASTEACLEAAADRVINDSTIPGSPLRNTKVIVRLYRFPTPSPATEGVRDPQNWSEFTSKYDAATISSLNSFVALKGTLITTEVFYKQSSLLPTFSGSYYETTIF